MLSSFPTLPSALHPQSWDSAVWRSTNQWSSTPTDTTWSATQGWSTW